jgi:hypothetical protein
LESVAGGVWLWCAGLAARPRNIARDDEEEVGTSWGVGGTCDDDNDEVVAVVVDRVEVSGVRACPLPRAPCLSLVDARRRGFVGTAVCVELLDADELEGDGEDGREGVGVMAEEDSECVLAEATGECAEVEGSVGDVGLGVAGADDGLGDGSRISDARYCSCKDASDEARRYKPAV